MAIIVNGTSIPTDGDYIIVNGVNITKVIANGVVVWEKETGISAKPAPPFIAEDWKAITTIDDTWWNMVYNEVLGRTEMVGGTWGTDYQTQAVDVTENVISGYINLPRNGSSYNMIVYCCSAFSTDNYNIFNIGIEHGFSDADNDFCVIRYSNDKTNWTNWFIGNTIDHLYKYAQIGYYAEYSSDDDDPFEQQGFTFGINSVSFS